MERWLKLVLVTLAAVVVAAVVLHDRGPSQPARSAVDDVEAETAPDAPPLELQTMDGKSSVDLKSLRGRVVAVNFWATWCPPCMAELPQLTEFWKSRRGRCFELVGVAGMSPRVDAAAVARPLPFPVLYDEGGDALDAWSVRAFPRTFVVDAQGRVRKEFRGMVDEASLAQAVDPLLPTQCPGRNG